MNMNTENTLNKNACHHMIYPWAGIDASNSFWKHGTFKDHFNATRQIIGNSLGEEMKEIFVEQCREQWRLYKDILSDCTVYDNETMDKCTDYNIWKNVMNEARNRKLVLKGREKVDKRSTVSIFDQFSMETLKDLYSRDSICTITQYFIDEIGRKNYDEHKLINPEVEGEGVLYAIKEHNAKMRYSDGKEKTQACERKLNTKMNATKLIKMMLYDKKLGNDGYDFIIQHLQFATLEDMKKLMELSKKKFIIRKVGKPSKNLKICKYDKNNDLVAVYNNRQECMKIDNISKSALSNVLSGKRKTCNGYIYDEVELPDTR